MRCKQVTALVRAFNEDGREFIRLAARRLLEDPLPGYKPHKSIRERELERKARSQANGPQRPPSPSAPPRRSIDHFVMNLPDTAIEFLDAFRGILSPDQLGDVDRSGVYDESSMPMVHCYCFTRELEPDMAEVDIRQVRLWESRSVSSRSSPFVRPACRKRHGCAAGRRGEAACGPASRPEEGYVLY